MRDGWVETTLAHVAEVNPRVGGVDSESPFITMADVDEWGRWARTSGPRANRGGAKAIGGDVLVARITPCLENGKIAQVPHEWGPVGGSTEFLVVRAGPQVLPDYLYYWAQEPQTHLRSTRRMIGTSGRKRVSAGDYEQLPYLLPPIEEQRRIVDLMSHVDSLRTALSEEAARLFSALCAFRDSIWNVPQRVPLSRYCRVDGGLVDPTGEGQRDRPHVGTDRIASGTGDLIGVQSASEDGVTSGKFEFSERHVVYSKIRPNLMKVAMPTFSGLCSADAYPLLPAPGVPRRWLQQLLLTTEFTTLAVSQSGRTKMPKINQPALMGLMVPDIADGAREEQPVVLDALDALRVGLGKERDALDRQRAALLGSLLTGDHEIPSSYDEFIRDEGAA